MSGAHHLDQMGFIISTFVLRYYVSAANLQVSGPRHYDPGKVAAACASAALVASLALGEPILKTCGVAASLGFGVAMFSPILHRWALGVDRMYWRLLFRFSIFLVKVQQRLQIFIDRLGVSYYNEESLSRYFQSEGGKRNPFTHKRKARKSDNNDQFYSVLQLDSHYEHSIDEIEDKFRLLILQHHPDKQRDEHSLQKADEFTKLLTAARRKLVKLKKQEIK
eukprot:Platyproteum_vivax@DN2096_c0_g1_i1.p1